MMKMYFNVKHVMRNAFMDVMQLIDVRKNPLQPLLNNVLTIQNPTY